MEVYLAFYFLLNILSCLLLIKIKHKRELFLLTSLVSMILLATTRGPQVGTDLSMYLDYYNSMGSNLRDVLDYRIEWGYALLNYIVYWATGSETIFLFLVALTTYSILVFFFYKCSYNPVYSIIIFVGMFMYCMSYNAIRQYLAVAFLCLAYYLLQKNSRKAYILLCFIIATLFHKTAIIMLPVFALKIYFNNFKKYTVIFILTIASWMIIVSGGYEVVYTLIPQYAVYETLAYSQSREITASIVLPIISLIYIFISSIYLFVNRKEFDRKLSYYNFLLLLYSLSWLASFKVFIFYRFLYYFEIFICLVIPYIVERYIKQKTFIYSVISALMFIYFILHLSRNTAMVVPYYSTMF